MAAGGSSKRWRRRLRLFAEQDGLCHWCGEQMLPPVPPFKGRIEDPLAATIEHVIPRFLLGEGRCSSGYVVAAHRTCNMRRPQLRFPHDPVYGEAVYGETAMGGFICMDNS